MKKLILLIAISFSLFSCQNDKTAFVDSEILIEEYQQRKDLQEKYKIKDEALKKKRDSIGNDIKKEVEAFQAKNSSLPIQKQQELYMPIQQKSQYLSNMLQQEQQKLNQEMQVEIDSLLSKIDAAVVTYGKNNGYAYIFGKNKAGSVIYGSDKNDLTNIILEELNNNYAKTK